MGTANRTCKACGASKLLSDFPPYVAKGVRGHRGTCRDCWNAKWTPVVVAHNARYYHENHAGMRDAQKERTAARRLAPGAASAKRKQNELYAARHPEKAAAKQAVAIAVRSGRLIRQACEACGTTERVQAHHDDYSKPLDVLWLCPIHHGERHRLLNRFGDPSEWPEDLRVREFPAVEARS